MHTSRREFVTAAALLGSAAAVRPALAQAPSADPSTPADGGRAARPLEILILGGTIFLGPAIVDAAKRRGHKVTLFNRGKHNPEWFPELEKLRGDRDPDKGEGLKALAGRKWDAVIDDCGYFPRHVKASAELLAPNVGHYTFISTISTYASSEVEGADESAPLATMADPTLEEFGKSFEYYGPLKVLCEQAAEAAFPQRTCVIRPGFIVGPKDTTDRFTYWPVRVVRGDDMLAPGSPTDPVQVIDVRDLGEFAVLAAEKALTGRFNACGPGETLTMGKLIESCNRSAGATAKPVWVTPEFLNAQARPGDGGIPIWVEYGGESKGFHTWSNKRAVDAGLRFRSIDDTVAATLAWWYEQPAERRAKLRAGLTAEAESRILEAWAKEKTG
ncbi:MAG: epimerase [Planctomycetes bacterium]|nr:epimerase [Planctomycetota bacterium]